MKHHLYVSESVRSFRFVNEGVMSHTESYCS